MRHQTSTDRPAGPRQSVGAGTPQRRPRRAVTTTIIVVGFAVAMLGTNAIAAAVTDPLASLLVGAVLAAAMMGLYIWVGLRIEKRSVAELDRRRGSRHLLWGIAAGLGLATLTIGILAMLGAYRFTGWGSIAGALAVVGMMAAVAVSEEVFFRGIFLRLFRRRWGVLAALAASSLAFGLIHLLNPGASLGGALAVAIEAGLMLGAAYLLTGSLWLAIGIHFGWNVALGGIFGTVVSGSGARESLFTAVTAGPDWLTGGAFGPEGSIVAVVVCSLATVGFLLAAHRRGRLSRRRQL